jgi:Fe-S-cluster containining protein
MMSEREELEKGLRFLHGMATQLQSDMLESRAMLYALVEVLGKQIDLAAFEEARGRARVLERERKRVQLQVHMDPDSDKYAAKSPADLDCKALLPICKARCCQLTFALSKQDLDEGVVRWRYGRPYLILRQDNRCAHQEADGGCGVYEHRPRTCRVYDCRTDKRIWEDFEKRVLAPPLPQLS